MYNEQPLVSIIIPVYNGKNFLGEAIKSAISQSYPSIEIVVVNDGSDDQCATELIAKSFGDQVRYFYKPNGGIASALNFGISKMKGELFSWLSHDDIYEPRKIEANVRAYLTSDKQSIIYSDFYIMDKDSNRLYSHNLPPISAHGMRCFLTRSSALHGCTLLIPRAYLQAVGDFDVSQKATQDYDMWFRLASLYSFLHVKEQLVGVRFHSDQGTSRLEDVVRAERDQLYCKFLRSLSVVEVEACNNRGVLRFYLQLYVNFYAGRLATATAFTKAIISKMFEENPKIWHRLHFCMVRIFVAPMARQKAIFRQILFKNDSNYFVKAIIRLGRWLLRRR